MAVRTGSSQLLNEDTVPKFECWLYLRSIQIYFHCIHYSSLFGFVHVIQMRTCKHEKVKVVNGEGVLRVTQMWSSSDDFSITLVVNAFRASCSFFLCSGFFIPISWDQKRLFVTINLRIRLYLVVYWNTMLFHLAWLRCRFVKFLIYPWLFYIWVGSLKWHYLSGFILWPSQNPEEWQTAVSAHFQPTVWWDWDTGPVRSLPASHTPAPWSTGWMEYSYLWNQKKLHQII